MYDKMHIYRASAPVEVQSVMGRHVLVAVDADKMMAGAEVWLRVGSIVGAGPASIVQFRALALPPTGQRQGLEPTAPVLFLHLEAFTFYTSHLEEEHADAPGHALLTVLGAAELFEPYDGAKYFALSTDPVVRWMGSGEVFDELPLG